MIARDGFIFIGIGFILSLVLLYVALKVDSWPIWSIAAIIAILTLFTVFFFRDPERYVADEKGLLVAPADGKIVAIEEIGPHDFIGGTATRISIFLSVFDVHVNRTPASGVIDFVRYNPGKFLAAFNEKASMDNEQTEIGLTTSDGSRVIFKQIAGLIARRIVCRISVGDTLTAGQRIGMIRFGSRMDIIIPSGSKITTAVGNHVKAGETIIGYLPAAANSSATTKSSKGQNVEL